MQMGEDHGLGDAVDLDGRIAPRATRELSLVYRIEAGAKVQLPL